MEGRGDAMMFCLAWLRARAGVEREVVESMGSLADLVMGYAGVFQNAASTVAPSLERS